MIGILLGAIAVILIGVFAFGIFGNNDNSGDINVVNTGDNTKSADINESEPDKATDDVETDSGEAYDDNTDDKTKSKETSAQNETKTGESNKTKESGESNKTKESKESAKEYDFVAAYIGDRALVRKDGKIGFIDTNGKEVIPCVYSDCTNTNFKHGYIGLLKNGKWGCVDKNHNIVVGFDYDYVYHPYMVLYQPHLQAKKNGKWGLINLVNHKLVLGFEYDSIYVDEDGKGRAMKNGVEESISLN